MHTQVFVLDHDPSGLRQCVGHIQRGLRVQGRYGQPLPHLLFLTIFRNRQAADRADVDTGVTLDTQFGNKDGLDITVETALDLGRGLLG